MKKILAIIIVMLTILCISNVKAAYTPDKQRTAIKRGDVIYFDTRGLDWSHVYIHMWEDGGDTYKDWGSNDEMTLVDGSDHIYMFTAPNDIDEKYNMIIFHNEYGGNANQTINLSFIEQNYVYKITGYSGENRIGYWYIYDKTELETRLAELKEIQNNKDYYTNTSYANLDEIITNIETAIQSEVALAEDTTNPGTYYIQVDYLFGDAEDITGALTVDTTQLETLINQEESKYDEYYGEYTKNSVDALKEAIEAEKTVLAGNTITVDDVKNGINSINTAKTNLKLQANKEELIKELQEIASLEKDKYTEESFKKIEDLLDDANEIKNDTNATQDEVDEMVEKLKGARTNLKEKGTQQEETKETKENKEVEAPKTLDDIVKIFIILGGCVVALAAIVVIMKKMKKD